MNFERQAIQELSLYPLRKLGELILCATEHAVPPAPHYEIKPASISFYETGETEE